MEQNNRNNDIVATSSDALAQRATTPALPPGAVHPIAQSRLKGVKGRPDMITIGVWIWLASELMFFAGLFAAYFTIQSVTNSQVPAGSETLFQVGHSLMNIPFAIGNTTILVLSSVTCQMGVIAAARHRVGRTGSLFNLKLWGLREWYILTFIMGAVFVSGQVFEYATLISEGLTLSSDVYGSIFYLATGFHGLHVVGGLIAFLFVLARTYMARVFTKEQELTAEVVSFYWHFVDVVWIALFGVIYILPMIS